MSQALGIFLQVQWHPVIQEFTFQKENVQLTIDITWRGKLKMPWDYSQVDSKPV